MTHRISWPTSGCTPSRTNSTRPCFPNTGLIRVGSVAARASNSSNRWSKLVTVRTARARPRATSSAVGGRASGAAGHRVPSREATTHPPAATSATPVKRAGRAFLEARPVVGHPPGDGRVVALPCLAGQPPRRVPPPGEPLAEIARVEPDVERPADQLGDAAGRPQVGAEAVGGGLLGQPAAEWAVLLRGEEAGESRGRLGGQPGVAGGAVLGHPLGDGDGMNAELNGHRGLRPPAEDQLNRSPPHGFQFGSRSVASHGEGVTYAADRVQ